ncbi:hypothetical protein Salat_2772300 [Sesamum alatum]|uniref:SAWADEE domain-containing protein n=1 Tax=Sesamum alatum TaxID=300844 RepID=A0AAE1XLL2_9LAMI|nr:hypothetical protein Salat_2772300 [Sesamum alatum]
MPGTVWRSNWTRRPDTEHQIPVLPGALRGCILRRWVQDGSPSTGVGERFRPLSHQLQDHECGNLDIGTTVCAAHGSGVDDLRFFDAVIEAVNHQTHSFAGREEECLCTFVLFWLHGRGAGTLTSANIASICTIEPFPQIDPRISAFAILAEEKIASSKSISVLDCSGSAPKGQTSCKRHICKSVDTNLEPSQNRLQETGPSTMRKSLMWKSEDSGRMSNHKQWKNQDEDIGPAPCNFDGLATAEGCHFIPINNLEKDLIPSTIKKFIYKQTGILPQAFVFPRLLSDPFARGAIVVDCRKKFQIIHEFLDNPTHLIVSSRERPWVITEEEVTGTVRTTVWNLIPRASEAFSQHFMMISYAFRCWKSTHGRLVIGCGLLASRGQLSFAGGLAMDL